VSKKRSFIEVVTDAAMTLPVAEVGAALAVAKRILANRTADAILTPTKPAKATKPTGKRPGRPRKQASAADPMPQHYMDDLETPADRARKASF